MTISVEEYSEEIGIEIFSAGVISVSWRDGTTYKGQWRDNKMHGNGKMFYSIIDKGEQEQATNNQIVPEQTNVGTMFTKDGFKYFSTFKNHHPNKTNSLSNKSELVYYDGVWKDGKQSERGTTVWKNGSKYHGMWEKGQRNGGGLMKYEKDNYFDNYFGNWVNDKFNGIGILVAKNGEKYFGDFENDEINGHGTFTFAKESELAEYVGHFKNGVPHGKGSLHWRNETIFDMKFEEILDGF